MKKTALSFLTLILLLAFFACGHREKTKEELLVGKWRFFSMNLMVTTGSSEDKMTEKFYQDMAKNTEYIFEKEGNYTFRSSVVETGTWKITPDGKTITLTDKAKGEKKELSVVNLTQKELVYTLNGAAYKYLRRDEE